MPYERIVQWLAGPTAAVAGWLATQLVNHVNVFGALGLSRDQVARAIVDAMTFAVTALVTYAAHQKWLDNLPKWWAVSGLTEPACITPSDVKQVPPLPAPVDPGSADEVAILRHQLQSAGLTPEA
jgi:hypothetical protein